jgi:hypothetical protein
MLFILIFLAACAALLWELIKHYDILGTNPDDITARELRRKRERDRERRR